MKFKFISLTLHCKSSEENLPLQHQVSYFHGPISTGKSTIPRLIDFCLGGDLEKTPALKKELISVSLNCGIGQSEVLFERWFDTPGKIRIIWKNEDSGDSIEIPARGTLDVPILNDDIFSMSDLIYHFLGFTPIKVRKNQSKKDAKLIRLSFRDILWFCYIDQEGMDSKFFHLFTPMLQSKARNVMRLIMGFFNDELNDLEAQLNQVRQEKESKRRRATEIQDFLNSFKVVTKKGIEDQIRQLSLELNNLHQMRNGIRENYVNKTSFADDTRRKLSFANKKIEIQSRAIEELGEKINEYKSLKAELITARMKVSRIDASTPILDNVVFEVCPACGNKIHITDNSSAGHCYLCKQDLIDKSLEKSVIQNVRLKDFDGRIKELNDIIKRHTNALANNELELNSLRETRETLQSYLNEELSEYDTSYVSETRELESQIATLNEKLRTLRREKDVPNAIEELVIEANNLERLEQKLEEEKEKEIEKLSNAQENVKRLEMNLLSSLLAVDFPGVTENDVVKLDYNSWIPYIYTNGNEDDSWTFKDVGSGGKKTLMTVCYALAIHQTAAQLDLLIPPFLIIDSPMKNIDPDVNKSQFLALHRYLYSLASGDLRDTQFIVIDTEFVSPFKEEVDVKQRFMNSNDPDNPPLIRYYSGP